MEFNIIKMAVEGQLSKMLSENERLFTVSTDPQKLWDLYLDSIPENPMFRARREYDCSCCRHYMKYASRVVAIKDGKVETVFDAETSDSKWNGVLKALREYILSCPINSVFVSKENAFGTVHSIELDKNTNKTITWEHFHTDIPNKFLLGRRRGTLDTILGDARTSQQVFKRSLEEISMDSVVEVLELCQQKSLYKGEEWESTLMEFRKLKMDYDKLSTEREKDLYAWEKSASLGGHITHMRNHSMGTLLVDLSEGKDLDEAVKAYERIVAPANYKRPKAIFTQKMLDEARKTIMELGYGDSIKRRFANLDDITVNNILFCDREASKRVKGAEDLFDALSKEAKNTPKNFSKVEEIGIEDFVKNVLPSATSIEAYVEGKHTKNFCSLIAPEVKDSKSMFKWNNNFGWAYSGNMTDSSLKANVKNAGGKVDGVLRFSIQWNDNSDYDGNDEDAHCIEPRGNHIYYANRVNGRTGGNLDIDIIHPDRNVPAVENITWPELHRMEDGSYRFFVHCFSCRGGRSGFRAEIEFDGQLFQYNYTTPLRQDEDVDVATVTLKNGQFTIVHHLPAEGISRDVWGVKTQEFAPVSVICYSPNYWDEQKGIGNKHYMFMLKDCVNPEIPNGWYNEFLVPELETKHKRVMEALASKAHVNEAPDQLSGLGFSSTQRNELVVKVKSSIERTLKIKF